MDAMKRGVEQARGVELAGMSAVTDVARAAAAGHDLPHARVHCVDRGVRSASHARHAPRKRRRVRFDPVLVACLSLAFGALALVAPLPASCAFAAIAVVLRGRVSAGALALAAALFVVSWARGAWVLSRFVAEHAEAAAFIAGPRRCALAGEVVTSPSERAFGLSFTVRAEWLDCEGRERRRPTWVRLSTASAAVARGDQVEVIAQLGPLSPLENFDLPDPWPRAARHGVVLSGAALAVHVERRGSGLTALIDRARAHVRARIAATFSEPVRGMAAALVLGDDALADADRRAFEQSGLSHLLAVSGTHLVFAVLALVRALEAVLRRAVWLAARGDVGRLSALLGVGLAPLYADFAGGSGSAWRAALFLVAVLGVRALGRHVLVGRALALSLGVAWGADALVVFDYSFLLSLAATSGLILGSPWVRRVEQTEPTRALRKVVGLATTTLAATVPCAPVLLLLSPGLSVASVAANVLAAPFGESIALPLCLTHALSAPFPALEQGLAWAGSGALWLVRGLAHAAAQAHWLYVELPPLGGAQMALLALGCAALLARFGKRWREPVAAPGGAQAAPPSGARRRRPETLRLGLAALALAGVGLAELHERQSGAPRGVLRVTALDVGQGDATLVDLPDGRLVLIDGGGNPGGGLDPGEHVVVPTLRARRRTHVDIVVLSHPHPDHYGGLFALARAVSVGEVWDSGHGHGAGEGEGGAGEHRRLLDELAARGARIRRPSELCGAPLGGAGVPIEVLAPCPAAPPGFGANDASLVVRVGFGAHAALFTGDIERLGEAALLAVRPDALGATFLKVAHHGSRTSSSPAFVRAVSPAVASISSDSRNRFGHPHPETLATLEALGVRALRLDRHGAIEWWSDGERARLRTFSQR